MKTKHPEEAVRPGFEHVKLNIDIEVEADEMDIDNLQPASILIIIDKIVLHPNGPQHMNDASVN